MGLDAAPASFCQLATGRAARHTTDMDQLHRTRTVNDRSVLVPNIAHRYVQA